MSMNARERMLAAMDRKPVDRVPTDMWATPEIRKKLNDKFGDEARTRAALNIDGMANIGAEYIGPTLEPDADYWGMRYAPINYGTGTYREQCFYPLAEARTIDDLEAYAWPQADWFDYSQLRQHAEAARERQAVQCGYMAPFFFHNLTRGLERSLMDPYDDAEFTHHLINRISDFFYDHHRRMFEACDGLIDVAQVTDDYGEQNGLILEPTVFDQFYRKHVQRFIDLCHEFNIRVFHHDDGAIRTLLPTLVDMGIDVLNPIQWRCPGMDMAELKGEFGDRIAFHGAIDNQQTLALGSVDDVRAEVRQAIDALATDGTGFIVAPCHNIQPVTPIDNVLAMYDEAHRYGAS